MNIFNAPNLTHEALQKTGEIIVKTQGQKSTTTTTTKAHNITK